MRTPADTRLTLAAFERLQRGNWHTYRRLPGDAEIDARLEPVWQDLLESTRYGCLDLEPTRIEMLGRAIAEAVGIAQAGGFIRAGAWFDYLRRLDAAHPPATRAVPDIAASVIARLYWYHLPRFPLMTAWLHVSALAVQEGGDPLSLNGADDARLLRDLSAAGPPRSDPRPLHATLFPAPQPDRPGSPTAARPASLFSEKSPPS